MIVGAPPYPGYRACFVTNGSQDMVFVWALLIIWDGRKYKSIVLCPSSDLKGSIVDAHIGTRHPSM